MNYPNTVQFLLAGLVFLAGFSSCGQDHTNDDTSKPADGGTDGGSTCEADLEIAQRKLDECQAKLPK